jgi:YVTN family beta-propeller protein
MIVGNYLYAANDGSNSISAFSINPATGALTAVTGSPFSTGGSSGNGISMAATSQFLFAGNAGSDNISVFNIGPDGALTAISGSPFYAGSGSAPDGMKVTPDGKYLAVAMPDINGVGMFSIGSGGALSAVSGSPFAASGATGIEINTAGTLLFVPALSSQTTVFVFTIASTGALTQISGSPFTIASGSNSNAGVLSPDEQFLFVTNQSSNTITVLNVASNGSLSLVSGSPYAVGDGYPSGITTNRTGTYLFTANYINSTVSSFSIGGSGGLTTVTGSPFSTGQASYSGLESLVSYPPRSFSGDQHLPVELAGFDLSSSDGNVYLNWRTASELNNAGFEIDRAAPGDSVFHAVASFLTDPMLGGLGTTSQGKNYSYVDAGSDGDLTPGATYRYRLVDISTDGIRKAHQASEIMVNSGAEANTSYFKVDMVLPNRATGQAAIGFTLAEPGPVTVQLYSIDGRLLGTPIQARQYGPGGHQEYILTAGLPSGAYMMKLIAGRQMVARGFVIAR